MPNAKARPSFLKKRSKKLLYPWLRPHRKGSARIEKFFGSFFQKRTAPFLLLLLIGLARPARSAETGVAVHRGEHPGFTRIVFVVPAETEYAFNLQGDTVKLRFPGAGEVQDAGPGNRILSIAGGHDSATVTVVAGKTCRVWRNGTHIVVDVLDAPDTPRTPAKPSPKPERAATAAAAPKPHGKQQAVGKPPPADKLIMTGIEEDHAKAGASAVKDGAKSHPETAGNVRDRKPKPDAPAVRLTPAPGPASSAPALPTTPVLATPLPSPSLSSPSLSSPSPPSSPAHPAATPPAAPEPPSAEPLHADQAPPAEPSFAASLLPAEDGWPNGAILLPFASDVGAVAYRRGGEGFVVFDTAQPTDLGMLRNDPVYGGAAVSLLPAGTILHLKLTADTQFRLARGSDGWRVGIVPLQTGAPAIVANTTQAGLALAAQAPGRIVVIDDPATGGRLIAGTQRSAGQAWPVAYASAEFALLPTWQGIVVQPVSDRAVVKIVKDGFLLAADTPPPLSIPPMQQAGQDVASSAGMTRRFDFPPLSETLLRGRLNQARQDAAASPKLGRFAPRLRAAQAMFALGMDVEAAAVLHAAQADDPAAMEDPDAAGLAAMAHWLAGRATPEDIAAIDNPKLNGSDEVALWRALLHGDDADASAPAASLASSWKLVLTYPALLRRRLLAPMADLLQRGHQTAALRAMLAELPDHQLDTARAALLEADGNTDRALDALTRLAVGPDRLAAARARRARTELLLASHRIDTRTAAAQLELQLYAWRGGAQDFDLRMRLAKLDGDSGNWRAALAVLRETEPLYPEKHDILYAAEHQEVADLIHGLNSGHIAPLDVVAVAEECADLLAESGGDAKLAPVLADKLIALDLPDRAEPVLQHILTGTSDPVARAQIGLKLARLRLDLHGTKAALATLDASEAPDLPAPLAADRALARARAVAAGGNTEAALKLLADLTMPPALELRDRLEEQKHDWPAAEATFAALVQQTVPATGPLDTPQQTMLVHLAGLASQAGDMAALHELQVAQGGRISAGPRADLFRLLTESPVGAVTDLPRSEKELKAARDVPAALASLRER